MRLRTGGNEDVDVLNYIGREGHRLELMNRAGVMHGERENEGRDEFMELVYYEHRSALESYNRSGNTYIGVGRDGSAARRMDRSLNCDGLVFGAMRGVDSERNGQ